ncbi:MAG: divalent-cation tolerance protein CutA [Pirellulales bacterium]
MSEFLQITTTTATRHDAEQIAAELVSQRLAGCVQISGPIVSTYRWQGKTETSEEWICIVKTSREQLAAIKNVIDEIHPYEVPELIATPIVDGSEKYLAWLKEQLGN